MGGKTNRDRGEKNTREAREGNRETEKEKEKPTHREEKTKPERPLDQRQGKIERTEEIEVESRRSERERAKH